MAEPNYDINYDDKRFTQVESDKTAALSEVEKTYGGMISDSDKYYKAQIDASKEWAETQKKNQQAQTDFAIEQIDQQKAQAKKDYTKEQSGAFVDYQKASGEYGAEAEKMAAQGMTGTGFSESSQTAKYVAYQNRVAAARESYTRAVLNYDNAIKDARLQNNAALAEIAYKALKEELTLSLQGFQYKNTLLIEKANKKAETEDRYHNRYQDVLKQINTENALAENVRQYNESLAEQKRQHDAAIAAQNAQLALEREKFAWQKAQAAASGGSSGGGGGGGSINRGSSGSKKSSNKVVKSAAKGAAELLKNSKNNKETKNSNEKDLAVDTKSLVNAGLAGASAKKIAAEIKAGRLVEYVKNGKLTYKRVFNGTTASKNTNYSSVIKNTKAQQQFKKTLKYRG